MTPIEFISFAWLMTAFGGLAGLFVGALLDWLF
jgi:hypothetical protein